MTRLIEIAMCVNNIDPKGIGRICCVRYNDYVSQKEKGLTYTEWDDRDSFIASPFLPTNINYIPEIGQAVKVLNFTVENEFKYASESSQLGEINIQNAFKFIGQLRGNGDVNYYGESVEFYKSEIGKGRFIKK